MNPTDTAKNIFGHYITLLMETNGLKVDQDTHAEIDAAVESIVDAAVVQAKQEMQAEWGVPETGYETLPEERT